jgi:hypothetical protein
MCVENCAKGVEVQKKISGKSLFEFGENCKFIDMEKLSRP